MCLASSDIPAMDNSSSLLQSASNYRRRSFSPIEENLSEVWHLFFFELCYQSLNNLASRWFPYLNTTPKKRLNPSRAFFYLKQRFWTTPGSFLMWPFVMGRYLAMQPNAQLVRLQYALHAYTISGSQLGTFGVLMTINQNRRKRSMAGKFSSIALSW